MNLSTAFSTILLATLQLLTAGAYLWCIIAGCVWVFQQLGAAWCVAAAVLSPLTVLIAPWYAVNAGDWSLILPHAVLIGSFIAWNTAALVCYKKLQ